MAAQANITRRAAFSTISGLAATAAAAVVSIDANAAPSALDELIADFHWRVAESDAADDLSEVAYGQFLKQHPIPVVHYRGSTTWEFNYEHQIRKFFRWAAADDGQVTEHGHMFPPAQREKFRQQRDALIAELAALRVAWEAAYRDTGVSALGDLAEAACDARQAARDAILVYRPTTLAEMDVKNAFIVTLFSHRSEIAWREMASIFGGVSRETDAVTR
jgi:hypothetical protein